MPRRSMLGASTGLGTIGSMGSAARALADSLITLNVVGLTLGSMTWQSANQTAEWSTDS